jgi:hypothetical protein
LKTKENENLTSEQKAGIALNEAERLERCNRVEKNWQLKKLEKKTKK